MNKNFTFEEAINKYFKEKNIDYKLLHSEKKFDELKSNLNADNYLSLISVIFSISNKVILTKYFTNCFKRIDGLNFEPKIELNELKLMKFISKEIFLKLLEKHRKLYNLSISSHEFF